jgi:hypothetical protein
VLDQLIMKVLFALRSCPSNYNFFLGLTFYPNLNMGRIWTPAQAAPHPSSVSGLSFMGEQVLQALQKKWLENYNSLSSVTTVPAHYFLDTRQGNWSVFNGVKYV